MCANNLIIMLQTICIRVRFLIFAMKPSFAHLYDLNGKLKR